MAVKIEAQISTSGEIAPWKCDKAEASTSEEIVPWKYDKAEASTSEEIVSQSYDKTPAPACSWADILKLADKVKIPQEIKRPYAYESPIDAGHIDPNYYNLYNFDVDGYWEGSD